MLILFLCLILFYCFRSHFCVWFYSYALDSISVLAFPCQVSNNECTSISVHRIPFPQILFYVSDPIPVFSRICVGLVTFLHLGSYSHVWSHSYAFDPNSVRLVPFLLVRSHSGVFHSIAMYWITFLLVLSNSLHLVPYPYVGSHFHDLPFLCISSNSHVFGFILLCQVPFHVCLVPFQRVRTNTRVFAFIPV